METRHAQGVSSASSIHHQGFTAEIDDRAIAGVQQRHAASAAIAVARPHGRAGGDEQASAAFRAGEDSAAQRLRDVHRFDRRVPALRLTGAGPVPTPDDAAGRIAGQIAEMIGAERFARSFADQARLVVEGRLVEVRASTRSAVGLIERRFGTFLREAAATVLGDGVELRFSVDAAPADLDRSGAQEAPARSSTRPAAAPRDAATAASRARVYRLDGFVVGDSNRLAYNAAMQVAEAPAPTARDAGPVGGAGAPLFIHGPCGVGKTHLLQGIAQRFRELHPGSTVRTVSGETFLNEFVSAVRHGGGGGMTGYNRSAAGAGGIERFRRQYRRCDLLCIDDVHFLTSKQATQQELLHTFDQISQSGARLVMACDRHPREMKAGDGGFSPALVSRFLSGMVAGIDAPDASIREQAARMFACRRGLTLDPGALRLLVERTRTLHGQPPVSVRDLEGLVTRIEAVHRLSAPAGAPGEQAGSAVGVLAVERALAGAAGQAGHTQVRRPIRAEQIIAHTCLALGVERPDLGAPTRHKRVVLARAVITHLCRRLTTMSFPEIARAVGRPSHSTVITAHQRLQKQMEAGEGYGIGPGGEAMSISGLVQSLADGLSRA